MKTLGFLVIMFLIGTVFTCFVFSGKGSTPIFPDKLTSRAGAKVTLKSRKLKDNGSDTLTTIHLDDYRPIDPVPSATASIRPGPIQHGTPLMPYIPKHAPAPPPLGP